MTKAKRGLGKGLGAFFGEEVVQEVTKDQENEKRELALDKEGNPIPKEKNSENESGEFFIKISRIEPNREQPRKDFSEEQLQELADSIRQYGVLQPLLVQKKGDLYEIIAGERRWRAAKMAGLKEIPVVVREYGKQQAMEIALIENVQREDLNPIEEAIAYQRLMQEFNLKQEEIAERVSKNRSTITNSMRLLNLVPEIQQMLIDGLISSGHARALLAVSDPVQQLALADRIIKDHLSVREVEKAVKALGKIPKEKKKEKEDEALELIFKNLEERMKTVVGTKVNINRKDRSKGKIEIEYYSEAELERIVELIETIG
ncbi:MAG: ParB/RepB/Spo0J family partition protein [Lachnospiraceae bacterium]|nr:ParB/RepB/Spo0J family partition protein [Lachnospiraceae bacterium]